MAVTMTINAVYINKTDY